MEKMDGLTTSSAMTADPPSNQPMGAGSAESELFEAEGATIDQTAKLAPRSQAAAGSREDSFGRPPGLQGS